MGFPVKLTTLLLVMLGFFSCRKDAVLWKIENLSGNKVMVFGHGGMGMHSRYPTNSMSSLCECLSSGADGTEMDLQLSADSIFIVYHDKNLGDATTCSGKVSEEPASSVEGCKYKKGSKHYDVIKASALFDGCGSVPGKLFTFDCKLGDSDVNLYARSLIAFIKKYSLAERCFIESTDPAFLQLLESAQPSLRTYFYCQNLQAALDLRDEVGIDGVTIALDLINAGQVMTAHDRGLKVSLFGMRTERQNVDALMMSPDNLQTDKVEHLVKVYVKERE